MADKRNRTPFYGAVPTSKLQADHVFMEDGEDLQTYLDNFDPGTSAADYVVEEGTEDIWTYRKWNSGIAECWGTFQCVITGWNAWGSLYESASSTRYASFPTDLFNDPPVCVASHEGSNLGAFLETYLSATAERTPTYIHIRPSSAATPATLGINIYAKGTWK